jgi:hypothetical protein
VRAPVAPRLEKRRSADFLAELRERARSWIPEWDLSAGQGDFGQALLDVAARFSSEIAERLDQAGDKMRRGFLDWLGVRGKAARPARVPVVFKLNDSAQARVEGIAPLRLQANAGAVPVVFETEKSLTIIPAKLQMIVAADPDNDAYYLPPPDLTSLAPIEQVPVQWTAKSFAQAGATALQLTPGAGLSPGMLIALNGRQYMIKTADKDLVTIDRPLEAAATQGTEVDKVRSFEPFDPAAANQQEHILYIGDADLLNVEAAATFGVENGLRAGVQWEYWGKRADLTPPSDEVKWQPLDPQPPKPSDPRMLLLKKPVGSIEQLEINGHSARWIRAYAKKATRAPFLASHLAIEINPADGCKFGACPPPDGTASTQADGMANTAPLVLNNLFYPLGKEPRQFDAFYLGSNEAFSKAGAKVQLCFEMADRTFDSLSAVRSPVLGLNPVLVGVGHDRALHLLELDPSTGKVSALRGRPPLYPPSPGYFVGPQPGSAISLDKNPLWQPPVWAVNSTQIVFATAVCAVSTVWVWQEHPLTVASGWVKFGDVPSTSTSAPNVQSLIALNEAPGAITLFALRESTLYGRVWAQTAVDWAKIPTAKGGTTISLFSIVAVRKFDATFAEIGTAGMVGIDDQGDLYQVSTTGVCTQLLSAHKFNPTILPAAVEVDGTLMVAAVIDDATNLKLIIDRAGAPAVTAPIIANRQALKALEPVLDGGQFHVLLTSTDGNTQSLHDWVPFDTSWATLNELFTVPIDAGTTSAGPTEVDGTVVIPGNHADVLSASYDATKRFESMGQIDPGIVVSSVLSFLASGDFITRVDSGGIVRSQQINSAGVTKDGETLYGLAGGFPAGSTRLDAFPQAKNFPGSSPAAGKWQLDPGDSTTIIYGYIQIGLGAAAAFYHVDGIDAMRRATLTPVGPAFAAKYVPGWVTNGRMAPMMNSVPGTWKGDALDRPIGFPGNDPSAQSAKAFALDASNHPTLLALGREFNNTVANPFTYGNSYKFVIEAAVGKWNRDASGASNNNPELSWEYWNGKGWSRLTLDRDNTLNLQITGPVRFTVPADIAPSDWAGKTNPWIRARLIGGDYGREKFITTGTTTTRSTEDIHPPSVVNLTISYLLCKATLPAFVLTSDSGSVIDQSNANRSASANVEAFVPLGVTLDRLLQPPSVSASSTDVPCPPPGNCPGETSTSPAPTRASSPAAASATSTTAGSAGPCLLIGIAGTVDGEDVHLLALTGTEHDYTTFAPLDVEAIVANRFTRVVASDGTRALGETGVIEMSFAVPPSTIDLFGQSSLVWLRLSPRGGATSTNWNPSVAGLYLNAVFAQSTETLTRELLGSADGSPNLTFTLARPPVLDGTLELRVREPLGDQELADLNERGLVLTEGSDYWVKWAQIDDTADQVAGERVYMLDESTGEIRFGDGIHGMIPPTGRDSIVAFSYQRTEPPPPGSDLVPANAIPARTALNLVSPVETVESVTTAADSAGGAAPESVDTVLQFGYARLRHRDRALTLQDFEDLALESSTWIAQARAFPLSRGRVEVVVVRRGKDPRPTLPQIRELRRYLLSMAPAGLALPGALTIAAPGVRTLRIELNLDVEALDMAADVSVEVKELLTGLFDTTTGNLTRDGWPPGLTPAQDVVASAIRGVDGIASIVDITFVEIDEKGNELSWPDDIKATELVVLADDPVRLEFHSLEVVA